MSKLKSSDYPDTLTIAPTTSGHFRYTAIYVDKVLVLESSKSYPTHSAAYRASVRAIKAEANGDINFIE